MLQNGGANETGKRTKKRELKKEKERKIM